MKSRRLFVVERHEEYGMLGLRPKDCPSFDPLTGMATAHDMMEHPPRDTGEVHEELMAFGASIITRYLGGYWNMQRGPVEENWNSDVSNILLYVDSKGRDLQAPEGRAGTIRLDDEDLEGIVQRAGLLMSKPDEDNGRDRGLGDAKVITRWLRLGYRLALKRYRGCDVCSLAYLFKETEKAADDFLSHAYEGQEVEVCIDTDQYRVRVDEVEPEYAY